MGAEAIKVLQQIDLDELAEELNDGIETYHSGEGKRRSDH